MVLIIQHLRRRWCRSDVRERLHYYVLLDTYRHDTVLLGGLFCVRTSLGEVSGIVGSGLCGLDAEGERYDVCIRQRFEQSAK